MRMLSCNGLGMFRMKKTVWGMRLPELSILGLVVARSLQARGNPLLERCCIL